MFTWTSIAIQDNQNTWGWYVQRGCRKVLRFYTISGSAVKSSVAWQQVPPPTVTGRSRDRSFGFGMSWRVKSKNQSRRPCERAPPVRTDKMLQWDTLIIQYNNDLHKLTFSPTHMLIKLDTLTRAHSSACPLTVSSSAEPLKVMHMFFERFFLFFGNT